MYLEALFPSKLKAQHETSGTVSGCAVLDVLGDLGALGVWTLSQEALNPKTLNRQP